MRKLDPRVTLHIKPVAHLWIHNMYMTTLPIQDTRANRPLALINRIRASIAAKHCEKDAAHGVNFCMYKLEHLSSHSGNTWVLPENPGYFVTFATPPPHRTRSG